MSKHFNNLARHSAWADALLWNLADAVWESHFTELRERLHHWHLSQRAFVDVLSGVGVHNRPAEAFTNKVALLAYARETHRQWESYLSKHLDVDAEVVIPWIAVGGEAPFACQVREAIAQAMLHSQHHRGQLAMRLRDWGLQPLSTDFIYWLHRGSPAPSWPVFD